MIMQVRRSGWNCGQRFCAGLQDLVEVSHDDKLAEHDFPVFRIRADVIVITRGLGRREFQRFLLAGLDQFG